MYGINGRHLLGLSEGVYVSHVECNVKGGEMSSDCCNRDEAGSATCLIRAPQPDTQQSSARCPACQALGKPVQTQTIKALLAISLRAVQHAAYRFCRTPVCPVVYYAEDGPATFTVEQVRERVYQKEPANSNVFVCYCFRHTVGDVAVAEDKVTLLQEITRGIQAGQCACDLRNPQGSCCLGNVRALVAQFEAKAAPV